MTFLLSSVGYSFLCLTEATDTGAREYMEWHVLKSFELQRVLVTGQRVQCLRAGTVASNADRPMF